MIQTQEYNDDNEEETKPSGLPFGRGTALRDLA